VAVPQAHPTATVALWAPAEHRVGLTPGRRRGWVLPGEAPSAPVHHRSEWRWGVAVVHPASGRSPQSLRPRVTAAAFSAALALVAAAPRAGADHRVGLVIDQAGGHRRGEGVLPAGVPVLRLPASSPELQPVERLWPLCTAAVAHECFPDLAALEERLAARGRTLMAAPDLVHRHTHFHWWPPDPIKEELIPAS
jgi:DDE superfamily endonuclease